MALAFQLGNQQFAVQADFIEETKEGLILHGSGVNVNLPTRPQSYYRHGWQSWSLTTWHATDFRLPILKPTILSPQQTDPLYAKHPAPNGSWLGAVEFETGEILLLGALGLEAHVALHDYRLHGWYESGDGDWFVSFGDETSVFARYAALLSKRFGRASGKPSPRVWCSWYNLYTGINESLLHNVFDSLENLPFDVLQVDDGWQVRMGDWSPNEKFPSGMDALTAKIRASGRIPGLWLAPLLVVPSSSLFRQHKGWLLRDADGKLVSAGFNWGEPLYALDTTRPEVQGWLRALMKQVRAWGFDYLKLDFLYAGALPGERHKDMPREAAYRQGLRVMREAMGADAYFLACGAPIVPSLGLCDALRVGPDMAGEWESYRDAILLYNPTTPGVRNAIRTTLHRLWLKPLVAIDPDVAYFRSQHTTLTEEQKRLLQDLALVCNFKATSDLPQWLSQEERKELGLFLESQPAIERLGRYKFKIDDRTVDFGPAISLPDLPHGLDVLGSAFMGWLANQGSALKLLDWLEKQAIRKRLRGL